VNTTFLMAGYLHEPQIVCPKCSHQIPLTESIAAASGNAHHDLRLPTDPKQMEKLAAEAVPRPIPNCLRL
jgi:hypothetical protein